MDPGDELHEVFGVFVHKMIPFFSLVKETRSTCSDSRLYEKPFVKL